MSIKRDKPSRIYYNEDGKAPKQKVYTFLMYRVKAITYKGNFLVRQVK